MSILNSDYKGFPFDRLANSLAKVLYATLLFEKRKKNSLSYLSGTDGFAAVYLAPL
jgi:hypothetical protein